MSSRTSLVVPGVAGGLVLTLGGAGAGFVAGVATTRVAAPTTVERSAVVAEAGPAVAPVPEPAALPHVALAVHGDGCGVVRPDLAPEPDGLTWSVVDADGFQVLGRNALGETHYRYYQSGTYTVELQAWGGSSYVAVSDPVTITC